MAAETDNEMCWICLEEAAENGSHKLMSPCKCPRKVHPQCLARWQLQQAGRHEERFCRFCNNELADWKLHLTPEDLKPEVSKVQPIMVVYFEGQIHRIPVKQGPDGLTEFTGKIRELFRLPEDVDISLTFGCKEPMSGTHLKLEGMGAFDAAVHCASVAAAERQQKIKKSYSTGNLGSTPALAGGEQQQQMGRSASNSSIPAANLSASSAATAAGLSAAPAGAAQDRRRRFQGQQQQQRAAGRSQSFSVGSAAPSGRSSSGAEPPAAFRNILSMLGGASNSSSAGGAAAGSNGGSPFAAAAAQAPAGGDAAAAAAAGIEAEALRSGSGSPEPATASLSGGAGEQQRMKKGRLSLRNISELTDVPEVDETVAIGSLSGKFKLQLKAFSRKVARSLSFTNKVPGASSGSSSSAAAAAGMESYGSAGIPASGSSSRAASMSSPRVISYAAGAGAVSPSPRSMTNSPLPPPCPSPRLERVS